MIKFLKYFSTFLIYLFPLLFGWVCLSVYFGYVPIDVLTNACHTLISMKHFSFLLIMMSLFFLTIVFLSVCGHWFYEKSLKVFEINNQDGTVLLSINTIESFIVKVCSKYSEIKYIKPLINLKKNSISVRLLLKLSSGISVPEITERIQNDIKNSIQKIFGINNVKKINIQVIEIVSSKEVPERAVKKKNKFNEFILEGNEV